MEFVTPSVELLAVTEHPEALDERAGPICYKREEKITEEQMAERGNILRMLPKTRLKGITAAVKTLVAAQQECEEQAFSTAVDWVTVALTLLGYDLVIEYLTKPACSASRDEESCCGKHVPKRIVWKPVKAKTEEGT